MHVVLQARASGVCLTDFNEPLRVEALRPLVRGALAASGFAQGLFRRIGYGAQVETVRTRRLEDMLLPADRPSEHAMIAASGGPRSSANICKTGHALARHTSIDVSRPPTPRDDQNRPHQKNSRSQQSLPTSLHPARCDCRRGLGLASRQVHPAADLPHLEPDGSGGAGARLRAGHARISRRASIPITGPRRRAARATSTREQPGPSGDPVQSSAART